MDPQKLIEERITPHYKLPASVLYKAMEDARKVTLDLLGNLPADASAKGDILRQSASSAAYFYQKYFVEVLNGKSGSEFIRDDRPGFHTLHGNVWDEHGASAEDTLQFMQTTLDECRALLQHKNATPLETYLALLAINNEDRVAEELFMARQRLRLPAPQIEFFTAPEAGLWPGDASIPGGWFSLGATPSWPFVHDNEKWGHRLKVSPFKISKAPVTNAEFIEFVEDGGYQRPELWSFAGREWLLRAKVSCPKYWYKSLGDWYQWSFDQIQKIRPHRAVMNVNWYEVEAWCQWKGRRLPTELEWEVAASAVADLGAYSDKFKRLYPWGKEAAGPDHTSLSFRHKGAVDVAAYPKGDSLYGCRQMLGNVWEWTASTFYPFPDFQMDYPHKDYSVMSFGRTKVARGGSWATRSRLIRNTYRNFLAPESSDAFTGFRTCAMEIQ